MIQDFLYLFSKDIQPDRATVRIRALYDNSKFIIPLDTDYLLDKIVKKLKPPLPLHIVPSLYGPSDPYIPLYDLYIGNELWIRNFISISGSYVSKRKKPDDIDIIVKSFSANNFYLVADPELNIKVNRILRTQYNIKTPIFWEILDKIDSDPLVTLSLHLIESSSHKVIKVQDIDNYNPSSIPNKVLVDDYKWCVMQYANILDRGKEINITKDKIVKTFVKIIKEIVKRKKDNKMNFTATIGDTKAYKELWDKAKENLTDEEINTLLGKEIEKATIIPGKPFTPPKPYITRGHIESKYNIESLLYWIHRLSFNYPLVVQMKYDGLRILWHKYGNKVKAFTEQHKDVTNRVQPLCDKLKKLSDKDFILDSELIAFKDNKYLGRTTATGYINSDKPIDNSFLVPCVFDIVYYDKQDIHTLSYKERLKYLNSLHFTQVKNDDMKGGEFNKSPIQIAHNDSDVRKLVKKLGSYQASEGSMVKDLSGDYPLNGVNPSWLKIKHVTISYVIVLRKNNTKNPTTWNYQVGAKIPKSWNIRKFDIRDLNGKKYAYIGKTMNSDISFSPGDIISVASEGVVLYDQKTGVRLYVSTVIKGETKNKLMDLDQIVKQAEQDRLLTVKSEILKRVYIQKALWDPFLVYAPEKPYKYVFQVHTATGKALHGDLRMFFNNPKYLRGITLAILRQGSAPSGIDTMKEIEDAIRNDRLWKINFKTGKLIDDRHSLYSIPKAPIPKQWFSISQVIQPGLPGAHKEGAGVMRIVEQAYVEYGASKSYVHEFFFHGRTLHGRVVWRKFKSMNMSLDNLREWFNRSMYILEMKGLDEEWINRSLNEYIRKTSNELSEGVGSTLWLFIFTQDQTPYTINTRAITDKWVPPYGYSCLPKIIRDKIEKDYKDLVYWKIKDNKKRLDIRNELVKTLRSDKVSFKSIDYKKDIIYNMFGGGRRSTSE